MRLAVHQRDLDVDHRVAAEHALGQLVARTLLDRRDELAGHGPADDLVGELDAGAAVQRLDLQFGHGVLPVAAGLLDQPALDGGRSDERLTQRGPQRLDLHRSRARTPGARRATCPRGPGPSPTAPPGGFRRCAPAASSRPRRPAAAAPTRASPRRPARRRGSRPAAAARAAATVRPAPGRVFVDNVSDVSAAASLETSTRSPAIAYGFGRESSSDGSRQRSDALVVAVVVGVSLDGAAGEAGQVARHVQRRVGAQGAGEHPDQAEPADERGARGPHDFGDQRALRVTGAASPNGLPSAV